MSNPVFNPSFWENLLDNDFQSREIDSEELEEMITDVVGRECPGDAIEEFKYTDDGIEVILESGDVIDIEVDWNEIILL